jgi:hypothetical protein
VLPAAEKGIEAGGGHGLDFAAKTADGEAVNAGQEAAMAPFEFGAGSGRRRGEVAAQNLAFSFQLR